MRELAPAFSTADESALGDWPRRVAAMESGDESPHSKLRPPRSNSLSGRTEANFAVRELAPAFSTADESALGDWPRRVAAMESGDESPHSKLRAACPR